MIIVGAPVSRDISIKRCQVTRPYINNVAPTLIVVNIVIQLLSFEKNIGKDLDRLALGKTNLGKLDNTDHFPFFCYRHWAKEHSNDGLSPCPVCNIGLVSTQLKPWIKYTSDAFLFSQSRSLKPHVPYDTNGERPSSSSSWQSSAPQGPYDAFHMHPHSS